MRFACAIGLILAFLFAGGMARAQQTPSPGKLAPATVAVTVNKTTCEKSVAKIGAPAGAVRSIDLFTAMDVNKDGKICATEYKGPKKAFAWVDADHNGSITREEATRAYLTVVGRMAIDQRINAFKAMDENKDGKVSLAEYRGPTRRFARVDANHDGVITADEAKNAFRASVGRFVIASRFRATDANHDGKISATEFKGPKAAFEKYSDKNGLMDRGAYAKMIRARTAHWVQLALANANAPAAPPKPVAVVTKTNVVKVAKSSNNGKPAPPAAHVNGLNRILLMDTNKDGKIGMGEYFKAVEARFAYLDQDKDGYITSQDLAKVAEIRKAKGTSTPVAAAPVKNPVTRATLKPAKAAPAKPAVKPATGATGKPVAAVHTHALRAARIEAAFDQIDVNHDGVLTRIEIKTYVAKQPHANPMMLSHHKG